MRLWYPSVDHLAERAFELRESFGVLQAHDPRIATGEFCRKCGGGPRSVIGLPGRTKEVCATCRLPWTWRIHEEADIIRGEVDIYPRRGAAEAVLADQVDEWLRLRPMVFRCPHGWSAERWSFALEVWRLWLHARIGGYTAVAIYGREHSPDFGGMWTEAKVRYWLLRGQDVVTRRALRRPQLIPAVRRAA